MFQFTGLPSRRYGFTPGCMRSAHAGCPIRKSPDRWIFAPPRGFSQLITSFIGCQCQGIRPALFLLILFLLFPVASGTSECLHLPGTLLRREVQPCLSTWSSMSFRYLSLRWILKFDVRICSFQGAIPARSICRFLPPTGLEWT